MILKHIQLLRDVYIECLIEPSYIKPPYIKYLVKPPYIEVFYIKPHAELYIELYTEFYIELYIKPYKIYKNNYYKYL